LAQRQRQDPALAHVVFDKNLVRRLHPLHLKHFKLHRSSPPYTSLLHRAPYNPPPNFAPASAVGKTLRSQSLAPVDPAYTATRRVSHIALANRPAAIPRRARFPDPVPAAAPNRRRPRKHAFPVEDPAQIIEAPAK